MGRRRIRSLAFCAVAGAVLAASSAFAQETASGGDDRYHRHQGQFLRFDLGGGYLRSSATHNGTDASLSGAAVSFGVSLGASVMENLSVFGHASISSAPLPNASLAGSSVGTSSSSLDFLSIGPGVNYYFMPSNFYLSAAILMTGLVTTLEGNSGSTKVGFGATFSVGKEWWVSDRWGLGIAGQFSFGSNKDKGPGSPPTWTTITPALAFSASFG